MIFKIPLLKKILLKIKHGPKADNKSYTKYLKKKGVLIGDNVEFNSPWTINVDYSKPWLVSIGNNVIISSYVSILSHGADWRVLQNYYGDVIGSGDKVKIGDNVFIGIGSTILKGTTIGDNVIIGAGSVVTKDLESNGVYAGVPAKFIMSLEDYYKKRKNYQIQELKTNIKEYYIRNGVFPSEYQMQEYFWLFTNRSEKLKEYMSELNNNCSDSEKCRKKFRTTKQLYNSYDELLEDIRNEK